MKASTKQEELSKTIQELESNLDKIKQPKLDKFRKEIEAEFKESCLSYDYNYVIDAFCWFTIAIGTIVNVLLLLPPDSYVSYLIHFLVIITSSCVFLKAQRYSDDVALKYYDIVDEISRKHCLSQKENNTLKTEYKEPKALEIFSILSAINCCFQVMFSVFSIMVDLFSKSPLI